MTESYEKPTVLVITKDVELLSSLLEGNTTDLEFISRESMQDALRDPELLDNNEIVIFDIDSVASGTTAVVEQAIKLKKSDPTQVLMMVGDPDPLGEVLRSSIQPIVYRAFSKPIHPNQIFLAFTSACKLHHELIRKQSAGEDLLSIGPIENRANVNTVVERQKNKSALYAGVSLAALLMVGGLLFFMGGSETPDPIEEALVAPIGLITNEVSITTTNDDVIQINSLNQAAALAILDGRKISPSDNNALYFYDEVLAIDPYDLTAYEGRKALVADLKISYSDLVDGAEFDKALQTLKVLQEIEPLDPTNYEAKQNLESEINQYLARLKLNGTASEIARMSTMMAQIGPELQSTRSATAALQREQELITAIDSALEKSNLIPPTNGNAYAIVSEALQKNQISRVNLAPRVSSLSDKLIESARLALNKDDLEEAEKLSALVKRLGVDPQSIALLEERIIDRQTALSDEEKLRATELEEAVAVEQDATEEVAVEEPVVEEAPVKIVPAKVISREAPRYPATALKQDLEGWVSVGFIIDTQGIPQNIKVVDSDPSSAFEQAAIEAVEKWRFTPAKNEQTNAPIDSVIESTKLNFKITE